MAEEVEGIEGETSLGKLSEVDGVTITGDVIQIGPIKFWPNKVTVQGKPGLEDLKRGLIFARGTGRSCMWWLGDLVVYGESSALSEEFTQYIDPAHFSAQTVKQARWVCSRIAPSRRVNLSFQHHGAVARLNDEKAQDRWLQKAIKQKLTPTELRRAIRQQDHTDRYLEQDFPQGKYRVIYADFSWKYNDNGVITDQDNYGRAERHFPPMELEEIIGLPVKAMRAKNCAAFYWVPVPLLPEGIAVLTEHGFEYKTHWVWDKDAHNFGHYSSVRHELLLLGTSGSMVPDADVAQKFPSVVKIPRSDVHSQKPEEFRTMIDTLFPAVARRRPDRVELCSRYKAEGWDQWGNEVLQDAKSKAAGDDTNKDDNPVESEAEMQARREAAWNPRLVKGSKKTNGSAAASA